MFGVRVSGNCKKKMKSKSDEKEEEKEKEKKRKRKRRKQEKQKKKKQTEQTPSVRLRPISNSAKWPKSEHPFRGPHPSRAQIVKPLKH